MNNSSSFTCYDTLENEVFWHHKKSWLAHFLICDFPIIVAFWRWKYTDRIVDIASSILLLAIDDINLISFGSETTGKVLCSHEKRITRYESVVLLLYGLLTVWLNTAWPS